MQEYHPELLSRKGEATAWFSTAMVFVGWLILSTSGKPVSPAIPFLAFLLLLSALGISLGNWMDRRTRLQILPDKVYFENGLRKTALKWQDIQQIRVIPSSWGKKVHVIGSSSHFFFRTLGVVKVQGELKGKMGFADGEKILTHILENTGLRLVENTGNNYYYQRK